MTRTNNAGGSSEEEIVPRRRLWFMLFGVVVLIVGLFVVFMIVRRTSLDMNLVDNVTKAVSKHIILPDETPVLATITDKTALKTAFLKQADDGDKVLIYEKAQRVIIYRPSIDRIVEVGPVNIADTTE